jgi:hypothetical protein
MNHQGIEELEARLATAVRTFPYPPTPDIAAASAARLRARPQTAALRRSWVAAIVVLLLLVLMAVPPVRAQILEFIQIGIVRIFVAEPSPTATLPAPVETSAATSTAAQPEQLLVATATPPPATPVATETITPLPSLLDLAGETTLADAQSRLDFPILLPTYPADLGPPERVFLQVKDGQMLVLVWLAPDEPDKVTLSLHIYGSDSIYATKWEPENIVQTQVNGQPAIWAEGPYIFQLRSGKFDFDRLIEGHVLIWTVSDLTYRLETDRSLDEALKIAESLAPLEDRQPQPSP